MKELLDNYIRSLAERELSGDGPEFYQDLGTFVCWLLERLGYEIVLAAYHFRGTQRVKSSGRVQYGRDILAIKPDDDGQIRLYRFVLKKGDIGLSSWNEGERGSIIHDIWLAATVSPSEDEKHLLSDIDIAHRTVVAVHNGEINTEEVGGHRQELKKQLSERHGVDLEWWDANQLVNLALSPPINKDKILEEKADPTLFPPNTGIFIRMALDSLRKGQNANCFDYDSIDRLLDSVLPLGQQEDKQTNPSSESSEKDRIKPLRLYRSISELALFIGMLDIECIRLANGNTYPVLDSIERILCRTLEQIRNLSADRYKNEIRKAVYLLLSEYLKNTAAILNKISSMVLEKNSLSLPIPSDQLDFPLRSLRIGGYLAASGIMMHDSGDDEIANCIALALHQLFANNLGGFATPITDDQIIELGLMWELWLKLGMTEIVAQTSFVVLDRMITRKTLNRPLPAIRQSAKIPMDNRDLQAISETLVNGIDNAPPSFADNASSIIPLALYLFLKTTNQDGKEILNAFLPSGGPLRARSENEKEPILNSVYLQSWQPPDDAYTEWYVEEIRHRGFTTVYRSADDFIELFEKHNLPLAKSTAENIELPIVDRIAWKLFRTPPPMSVFIKLINEKVKKPDEEVAIVDTERDKEE